MQDFLFDNDVDKGIVSDYLANMPVEQIMKKYGMYNTYYKILEKYKVPKRQNIIQFNVDHDYFETIDTQDKAYFLGLLLADGCNLQKTPVISISLKSTDFKILEKLKNSIKYEGEIKRYRRKCNLIKSNSKIYRSNHVLKWSSIKMKKDLCRHGCVPNKTYNLIFPNTIHINQLRHFVRGFIDGDGWITVNRKNKTMVVGLVAPNNFCIAIQNLIKDKLNINCGIRKTLSDVVNRLDISGSNQVLKFLDWLYKDSTVYLERKYQKYLIGKKLIIDNRNKYKKQLQTERKGEKNGRSFLSEDIVRKIRSEYQSGVKPKDIEQKYNLQYVHVQKIVHRKIWKHI